MKILALETSTDACSVALRLGAATIERHEDVGRRHGQRIMAMIDSVFDEAGIATDGLDCVAVGHGPGSFTGVRIALSVGQGLAVAAGVPMAGVSSLAALAERGLRVDGVGEVVVAQDARMSEVYLGRYRRGSAGVAEPLQADALVAPAALSLDADTLLMGSGARAYPELAPGHRLIDGETRPRAADIAALAAAAGAGRFVAPEQVEPVYLRHRVAHRGGG